MTLGSLFLFILEPGEDSLTNEEESGEPGEAPVSAAEQPPEQRTNTHSTGNGIITRPVPDAGTPEWAL